MATGLQELLQARLATAQQPNQLDSLLSAKFEPYQEPKEPKQEVANRANSGQHTVYFASWPLCRVPRLGFPDFQFNSNGSLALTDPEEIFYMRQTCAMNSLIVEMTE